MRLRTQGRRNIRRKLPRLSMTATADISFMLLIFFLVTTSMDSEKGLQRNLPPKDSQEKLTPVNVERNNVLTIGIEADNNITINDTLIDAKNLSARIIPFILEKKQKHIIELVASNAASYDKYFYLQNTIVTSYREARTQMAINLFNKPIDRCTLQQQERVLEILPQRISEKFIDPATPPSQ